MRRIVIPLITVFCLLAARFLSASLPASDLGRVLPGSIDLTAIFDALIWLASAWLVKRAVECVFRRARPGSDEESIPGLAFDILGVLLFLVAIIGIVGLVFRQPVGGLIATSGILTGVLAFAVRDLIADIFAGVALAVERPIHIGDWIQFDEGSPAQTGRVVEMNWRAVRMVTVQGRTIVYPNNALSRREFVNLNMPERHFRTVKTIVVDFNVPAERAADIIMSAIRATPGVVQSETPLVLIEELGERGTLFSLHFWVPDYPQMFMIERHVVENVLHFLDQAGYSPAYPKLEVDLAWHHEHEIDASLDLPDLLHRVPLFSVLSRDELERLAGYAGQIKAKAGDTLVSEGEEGNSLFVVLTGLVSVHKTVAGVTSRLGMVEPGQVFGEMALLTGAPRVATVVADIDSVLLEIEREALQRIVLDNPAIIDELGQIQAARMSALEIEASASGDGRAEIEEHGLAKYLIQRIRHVFGHDDEG